MRQAQHLMAACVLMTVAVVAGIGWAAHAWTRLAQPGYVWSFPRDHWAREGYKTEWWYFTGHLRTVEEPVAALRLPVHVLQDRRVARRTAVRFRLGRQGSHHGSRRPDRPGHRPPPFQ